MHTDLLNVPIQQIHLEELVAIHGNNYNYNKWIKRASRVHFRLNTIQINIITNVYAHP